MSSSPSNSPFTTSLGNPTVDWVDVLGHFLDGDENHQHSNKHVVSLPSQPMQQQPISDAVPNPVQTSVAQTPITPNVVAVHTNTEPENTTTTASTTQQPGKPTLTAAEKARIRSERKRSREKQRRSDVNTQFSDLTALLKKIESEDAPSDESRKAFISELSTTSANNMNRVDLIGKTISVLNRIHNENSKRKRTIDELNEELKVTKKRADEATTKLQQQQSQPSGNVKSDHVMMMVPMMIRPDGTAQAPMMPQSMPFYPMCPSNATDKSMSATAPNFAAMFNPFMFGSQQKSTSPSESCNTNKVESTGSPSQQQFVPGMVSTPAGENGENLAHCA